MGKPIAIDLFSGRGGWAIGLKAAGWHVIGIDMEAWPGYAADELILQDVLTLHGAQFAGADLIVASPPCQEFSYRAMPWKRAKALPPPYMGMKLFWNCWRIQQEACEAADRYIPMVVENVKGAQPWVGRARWHYGSYYLWGDVPALMPRSGHSRNPVNDGIKARDVDGYERTHPEAFGWKIPRTSSHSSARKMASARIAMIPFELARWIGECYSI